jgi:hypothetical protein
VDENGNISNTPPDPTREARHQGPGHPHQCGAAGRPGAGDLVRLGVVSFFNDSKGYGFIKDQSSQESIFVHANGLAGGPIKEATG